MTQIGVAARQGPRGAPARPKMHRTGVPLPLRPATRRMALPGRGAPALKAVSQPQRSEAERFVEELALESAAIEAEDSLVVGSLEELRSRLSGLQAEVRAGAPLRAARRFCGAERAARPTAAGGPRAPALPPSSASLGGASALQQPRGAQQRRRHASSL